MFPLGQNLEGRVQRWSSSGWHLDLVMCKGFLGGIDFGGMKGLWKAAESWHCGRPGEATGEVRDSIAVEDPGWKESWKEAEAWHHVSGSESLTTAAERTLVKEQPGCR